jgi:V8-like Glu-specific endopeptidase
MTKSISFFLLCVSIFLACRTPIGDDSGLKLDEGIFDKDGSKYPMVWGIAKGDPLTLPTGEKFGATFCTGTAISKTVIITAAHCVKGNPPDQDYWLVNHANLALVDGSSTLMLGRAIFNPDAVRRADVAPGKTMEFIADIALIQFSSANFKDTLMLSADLPKKNDKVTIVGFGYDSAKNLVGRQYGMSKVTKVITSRTKDPFDDSIYEFYNNMIWVSFDRTLNSKSKGSVNSGIVPGDSGGPLIFKNKLAGTLFGGTYWNDLRNEADRKKYKDSVYTNLQHASNLAFLKNAKAQGWDVPI